MLQCEACSYEWKPRPSRTPGRLPKMCPYCRSFNWNQPAIAVFRNNAPNFRSLWQFSRHVRITETCWLWTGLLWENGYGRFGERKAHRVAYEYAVGPIPAGFTIDHVKKRGCRHRNCVRPDHLEPVTIKENTARGDTITARNSRKSRCLRGHLLNGKNLYLHNGKRICRRCQKERQERWLMENPGSRRAIRRRFYEKHGR